MAKERHREKERKRDRKGETLNHLSIHQWVRSAIFASHQLTSPIGFPFLKLPPPPCAVLLVNIRYNRIISNHIPVYPGTTVCHWTHGTLIVGYLQIIHLQSWKNRIFHDINHPFGVPFPETTRFTVQGWWFSSLLEDLELTGFGCCKALLRIHLKARRKPRDLAFAEIFGWKKWWKHGEFHWFRLV